MKEPVLQLQDVSLRTDRGSYVFRDLSLTIEPGQSAIISGAAGSGKTLLVEMLIGLRRVDQGTVQMFGQPLKRRRSVIRKVRRKIGGVGGPFGLVPSLTVAENINLPLVIAAERKKIQRERLLRMLSEFSLLKLAGKFPSELTRVENSLVQFARALVANQPLIIIDEPSAGLDLATYERIIESLVRVSLSGRSLLILVSETMPGSLPNTAHYRLTNGKLE